MTQIVRVPPGAKLPDDMARLIAAAVRACKVIAFPTDTVYGLGSTGLVKAVSRKLYQIKGRDSSKPLPILVHGAAAARRWVEWPPAAEALAKAFWPGAVTLVLKATAEGRILTFAEQKTVAIRVPAHPVAQRIISETGIPWVSTSANLSGSPALCDGPDVIKAFEGIVDFIVDAGRVGGRESTVVDLAGARPRILREGGVAAESVMKALSAVQGTGSDPGSLKRKLVFICTGNSCRSVMAERIFLKLAQDRGLPADSRSCGVAAERYFEVPAHVYTVLADLGIGRFEHVPQLVSREILKWADAAFVMTDEHLQDVLDRYPEFTGKVHVLGRHADLPHPGIEDPIGQGADVYAACRDKIRQAIEIILERDG